MEFTGSFRLSAASARAFSRYCSVAASPVVCERSE
jgi:hypothetical protein